MQIKRQGMIVWFQHRKNIKHIRRFGHLIYVSKKMNYAVLYVDQDEVEKTREKLLKHPYVIKVDLSYKPFIRTEYEKKKEDPYEYRDYTLGI